MGVALLPDPQANAEIVLGELHPISGVPGYAAEVYPSKILEADRQRLVMSVLGAGATVAGAVQRVQRAQIAKNVKPEQPSFDDSGRMFVSTDFYRTLLMMRAAAIPQFRDHQRALTPVASEQPRLATSNASSSRQLHAHSQPALEPPRFESDPLHAVPPPLPNAPSLVKANSRKVTSEMPGPAQRQAGFGPANDDLPRVARLETNAAGNSLAAGLRSRIRAEVIQLGGLYVWGDREVSFADRAGAKSAAEVAIERLEGRAPYLSHLISNTIADCRASVRLAYELLREDNEHDAVYMNELNIVAEELQKLMPLLILSPAGPYEQTISEAIRMLEKQYDTSALLDPASETVLLQLRQQLEELRQLSDGDVQRLKRVAGIIERYHERPQVQQALWDATDKRTLN